MTQNQTGPDNTTPVDRSIQLDSSGNLIRPEGMSDADWEQLQRDLLANTGVPDGIEPNVTPDDASNAPDA